MKWFKSLSEPMKIAFITGIFAIIAAIVGSVIAGIFALTSTQANRTPSQITNSPIVTAQTPITSTTVPQRTVPPTLVPSPTPIPNPYPPYTGRLVLNDPLEDNSRGYMWDEVSTTYGNCNFQQDSTYHVFSIPNYYHRCAAEKTGFSDFTFEVTLTIVRGYCGGMIFRADAQSLSYYYFAICQNGTYNFAIYTTGSEKLIQNAVSNSNIHTGLLQTNLIAVVAINNSISLYVNNNSQAIYTTSESNFSQGQIGLVAESDGSDPTDVSFSNAHVWAS